MAAEIGNDYARKYTEDTVTELLNTILDKSKEPNVYTLYSAFRDVLTWGQWDYIIQEYTDKPKVSGIIKTIQQNIESNIVNAAIEGKTKETFSMFLLKCKHGYIDKQQIDHNVNGSININLQFPDQED